jgi:hypothetical protein
MLHSSNVVFYIQQKLYINKTCIYLEDLHCYYTHPVLLI